MKTLEKGKEKIQQICDALREDTMKPALERGEKIVSEAEAKAEQIIQKAQEQAGRLVEAGKEKIKQERGVLQSAMQQATKQALESLRQDIENKLFNEELDTLVAEETKDPALVGKLVDAIITALKKEGMATDLSVLVPESVSTEAVNAVLGAAVLKRLRSESAIVGSFQGGAEVKVHDKRLTIEITDAAIKDLLARYVRKDFRELIFAC